MRLRMSYLRRRIARGDNPVQDYAHLDCSERCDQEPDVGVGMIRPSMLQGRVMIAMQRPMVCMGCGCKGIQKSRTGVESPGVGDEAHPVAPGLSGVTGS